MMPEYLRPRHREHPNNYMKLLVIYTAKKHPAISKCLKPPQLSNQKRQPPDKKML